VLVDLQQPQSVVHRITSTSY